jgi:hypothetical protein
MFVICLDNCKGITKSKIYEVLKISKDIITNDKFYTIKNNFGRLGVYYSNRFKPLSEIRINKLKRI